MALFDGFLLVSDVDATLLDEKKNIPAANLAAIERFKALGGAFTIATGRTHITCEDIAVRAGVNAPVVVYNGGGVYDRDARQFLWRRTLARDTLIAPFRALMARYPDVGVEVNAGDAALMVNAGAPIDPNVLRGGFPYRRADIADTPAEWFKIMFNAPEKRILRALEPQAREMLAPLLAQGCTLTYSGETYLELLPASKGAALEQLARMCGYARERVVAVGDYDNDLEMIRWAGLGVAVANAQPDVRAAADAVVCDCNEGAIAQTIELIERKMGEKERISCVE